MGDDVEVAGSVCCLTLLEAEADVVHENGAYLDLLVVSQTCVVDVIVVAVDVLVGVAEDSKEEADGPGVVYPDEEKGQGSKRAVDGVVAGQPYLYADI